VKGSIVLCVEGENVDEIFDLVQKVKEKKGELYENKEYYRFCHRLISKQDTDYSYL
jgi:hypothetical protein